MDKRVRELEIVNQSLKLENPLKWLILSSHIRKMVSFWKKTMFRQKMLITIMTQSLMNGMSIQVYLLKLTITIVSGTHAVVMTNKLTLRGRDRRSLSLNEQHPWHKKKKSALHTRHKFLNGLSRFIRNPEYLQKICYPTEVIF